MQFEFDTVGVSLAHALLDRCGLDSGTIQTPLMGALEAWLTDLDIVADPQLVKPDRLGVFEARVAGWHVRIRPAAWAALRLLPLLLIDGRLGLGMSVAGFHGVLEALASATRRLSPAELAVLHRLLDQQRWIGGASVDSLYISLREDERAAAKRIIADLIEAGVIEEVDGILTMPRST